MMYGNLGFLIVAIIAFLAGYLISKEQPKDNHPVTDETGQIVSKELGKKEPYSSPQTNEMTMGSLPNFFDDRQSKETGSPLGDEYPGWMCATDLPTQRVQSGCMVGCDPCSPLCSGEGNPCNITAPVPSPVWQPQSASTVQYRLKTGNYVPAYCPQGSFALQVAPACGNLGDIHESRAPKQVTCFTANRPLTD